MIDLYSHQKEAMEKLKNGSILCGGVGTGKSRTSLAYYFKNEYPKQLYIITTARKRDSKEWIDEFTVFDNYIPETVEPIVDSWNNIGKYKTVKDAFFIFDEQKVVGAGVWVKSFLKICKSNRWILLSATPGDTWMDYIPVFIANDFYKNRTEFIHRHVIFSRYSKWPKIDRFLEVRRLNQLRDQIIVNMRFNRHTTPYDKTIITDFDKKLYNIALLKRMNPYTEDAIENISELCYILRRITNSDISRIEAVKDIINSHKKVIIFYNFDYELDLLISLGNELDITTKQWNGHKHEPVPKEDSWIYLVQYFAGAEAWNCIETDTIIFYSQSYSYKTTIQAAGRIDRLNTPFINLYYYYLRSMSSIDLAIYNSLKNKQDFNTSAFIENKSSH